MLVLGRAVDQVIDITTPSGELIEVTIVAIRGDRCRIGVRAHESITVHRREVSEAIAREQEAGK